MKSKCRLFYKTSAKIKEAQEKKSSRRSSKILEALPQKQSQLTKLAFDSGDVMKKKIIVKDPENGNLTQYVRRYDNARIQSRSL
jgi:hypothetical protein